MEILVPSALFLRPDIHPCPEEMERISFEWNLQVYSSAAVRKKNKKKYNNKNEKKNKKKIHKAAFELFLFLKYIFSVIPWLVSFFFSSLRIVATVLFGGSKNRLRWSPTRVSVKD